MILSHLNYLAVAVAAIAYFALGAVWFNPKVFGTMWAKGHNIDMTNPDRSGMGKMMVMTLISCFAIAVVCGYMMMALYSTTCMQGMKLGVIMGAGFSAGTMYINGLYTKKSFMTTFIDSGYHVAGITLCCIIISVWH